MTSEATISMQAYDPSELEMIKITNNPSHISQSPNQKETETSRTITNDSYFNSINEKEINTISINDEVIFSMGQDSLRYDLATVRKACPALSKYIAQIKAPKAKITINLPQWITKNALLEYLIYNKNNLNAESITPNHHSLLKLSDCFENYPLLSDIVKLKIIPALTYDSALAFIQDSFQKIDKNNLNFSWYELFTATKEYIAVNIIDYIKKDSLKLGQFQRNLLEEIIEYHLLISPKLEEILFAFLMDIRHCHNIYDLIVSEYLISSSEENINYLLNSSYPFLQYSFRDSNSFYQEITKQYNKTISLWFYVSYKETDDIFNVNFKIKTEDRLAIYSFTFVAYFNEGQDSKRFFSVKVISNTKGSVNILQIYQFTQKRYKKLTIFVKMNPIHSFTLQYLTFQFDKYYFDSQIVKISHTLLKQIILIIKAKKIKEENILSSVVLWLNDEININDDSIGEILELIDWKKIPMKPIYSFLIKYIGLIEKLGLEPYFIKELGVSSDLFGGLKDANCTTIINENFKLKKALSLINNNTTNNMFEPNKELSAISKANNNNNNLFDESMEEDEKKKLFFTSREYQTRNQRGNNNNNNNNKEINNNFNVNKTSVSENKKQSSMSNAKNKSIFEFYEPIRTIEYEVNSLKKDIEPYTSLSADILPMTSQIKVKSIQTNKAFILNSSKTISNNGPSSSLVPSKNHRTKTSTTLSHKSNLSSKIDKTLSSSGQMISNKKQLTKHQSNSSRNKLYSPLMISKTTRRILLSKGK